MNKCSDQSAHKLVAHTPLLEISCRGSYLLCDISTFISQLTRLGNIMISLMYIHLSKPNFMVHEVNLPNRVKSGKFRQPPKFRQRPCFFHLRIIGIKIKLTKQTVEILMRRLIKSRLIWISIVCKCMSEFT